MAAGWIATSLIKKIPRDIHVATWWCYLDFELITVNYITNEAWY